MNGLDITVTDSALDELGKFTVKAMENANLYAIRGDKHGLSVERSAIFAMNTAMSALGIPLRMSQLVPSGLYTYVEIGGKSFNVRTSEEEIASAIDWSVNELAFMT